jgi:hypothetical protein
MFSDERERVVVVVSGFDDDSDSVARRGEETVREPRAKSSANGGTAVTSVSIGNFRTAETRENAV